jgi:membrane associated rhomboid family serine protease
VTGNCESGVVIPLKDYNPTARLPFVTILIILACAAIYFFVQPVGQGLFTQRTMDAQTKEVEWDLRNAAIPCELTEGRPLTIDEVRATFVNNDSTACIANAVGPRFATHKNVYLAVLYSMFLHGSVLHLLGNMLFLWVFGNNIEDRMRPLGYAAFYLLGGAVATATHVVLNPNSTVPLVGASGAIAAVMGAYIVLFPNAVVLTIVPLFLAFLARIRAKWVLGFWFIEQFFVNPNSGVAWAAHVGGFVFGAIVAFALRDRLRPPRVRVALA